MSQPMHIGERKLKRSLKNFDIGNETIPLSIIKSLGVIKLAAAKVNFNKET